MRRRSLLVVAAIALSVGGQAYAGPSISTEAAPGANFAGYKTFSWVNEPIPAGMDPVAYQRIQSDVEGALAEKGYQKADQGGDLALVLTLGARQKTDFNSWGFFGRQMDVYQYTQGKLSLDAFDTKTRQAVWHGQASETINPDKPNPAKVDSAIGKLMVKFPEGGGAEPAAASAPASPP
jgi:hypothetical protein